MFLPKCLYEIVLRREHGGSRHKHHQNFTALEAPANQYMAKETKSGVLIIRPDFKGYQQMLNGLHDFLTGFVLDAAVPHWNNAVRVFFIGSGNNPTPSISGKNVMNLVPIIQRIIHANDGKNFPVGSKQLSHSSLLLRQLLLVGYSLILAAAAFLMDAANIIFCGERLFYCFRDRFTADLSFFL